MDERRPIVVGLPLAENLFIIAFALVSFAFQVFVVTVGVLVAWRWLNRRGGAANLKRRLKAAPFCDG